MTDIAWWAWQGVVHVLAVGLVAVLASVAWDLATGDRIPEDEDD